MTLKLTIEREVQPSEVASLVFGTGALTWGWWGHVSLRRPTYEEPPEGGKRIADYEIITDPLEVPLFEDDRFFITVDDPQEAEGSGKVLRKTLSMASIVHAAGRAIRGDGAHIDDESSRDMAREDLGYADAIAGDAVLQLAVFGSVVYG
jgi:hypothetical protein